MKFIEKLRQSIFLLLAAGIGFNSCTREGAIVVTPKLLSEYIADMAPFVNAELPFVRNCVVGYDKNNYSVSLNAVSKTSLTVVKAAYLAVLKADSALIVSPTVTITDLVAGNKTLGAPGKVFWTGINMCDKRPLNDAIVAATTLNNSVPVGTTPGTVPLAAKTTYTADIKTASTTRDATTTTIDRQITQAIDKLKASTAAFNAAIIK